MRSGRVVKAVAAASAVLGLALGSVVRPALIPSAAAATTWLATGAFFSDPRAKGSASNVTRNLVRHHFDRAAGGSTAQVTTWEITDTAITDAMIRAMRRGVRVRVLLAVRHCNTTAAIDLRRAVRSYAGSFVRCITGSARSGGGAMHQKSYTFSQVGSVRHVTVVGSANATRESFADQWVDLYQHVSRPDVYAAYAKVFALQQLDDDLAAPYRAFTFAGGEAQFHPVNNASPTAADDPVHRRLITLPKGRDTVIRVASFGMRGKRGDWLAGDLIAHKRAGSTVVVLTGPPASGAVERRLRAAGIEVTRAFDRNCSTGKGSSCNYIHLKLMTASFVRAGVRQYQVWTGSDNWSPNSLNSDEVSHRIDGRVAYRQYVRFVDTIRQVY